MGDSLEGSGRVDRVGLPDEENVSEVSEVDEEDREEQYVPRSRS